MEPAVRAENIFKSYCSGWRCRRRKEVLKGIHLQVEAGEIFGILGPNGVGKTTLLSILSTLLLPDSGEVHVSGIDAMKDPQRVREKVNISSGNANFLWSLTVKENLDFYGMLYGLTGRRRKEKVASLIEIFEMGEHRDVPFDQLSTGLKQRLSLAKCLINDPVVLFLDEPTVGLDPSISILIRDKIRAIQKERGMTVLLTTHNMKEAEHLCNRIAFLKSGDILVTGTADELKRMVRIGDVVKIDFRGRISEDELTRIEGVINYSVSDHLCEMVVDDGEKRLGPIIAVLSRSDVRIERVRLGQTDLEDVFVEFSKKGEEEGNEQ
jgi:ABC-2 type transport system ATP-binding protein